MIERVVLSNFRSFAEPATARFAPLTLIYGPNSAGKSSIIKSLLFLKQSAAEPGSAFFRFDGPLVDLGNARTTVHRHAEKERIGIDVGLGAVSVGGLSVDVTVGFRVGVEAVKNDRFILRIVANWTEHELRFRRIASHSNHVRLDGDESVMSYRRLLAAIDSSPPPTPENDIADGQHLLAFSIERLLPGTITGRLDRSRPPKLIEVQPNGHSPEEAAWNRVAATVGREFSRVLDGLSYLGPLRRPWLRVEPQQPESALAGVGSTGEHAVNVLARRPDLLEKVNESLRDLETGYELVVNLWEGPTGNVVENLVPALLVPSLKHLASGVSISPSDAGFGLSQLLPFIIDAHQRERSLICIEQPELHLHPRLQARVGQVLRNAVSGRNHNRFLIETHSEQLLLRLQRLIREAMLPADAVTVLYVDNQTYDEEADSYQPSIKSSILELRLTPSGQFLDPWPGGFFGERWEEMR